MNNFIPYFVKVNAMPILNQVQTNQNKFDWQLNNKKMFTIFINTKNEAKWKTKKLCLKVTMKSLKNC